MGRESLGLLNSPENEILLRLLREERERRGISQRQLAKILGWSQPRVWQIEAGTRRLDVVEYIRMTLAIGTSPAAIMAEVEGQLAQDPPQSSRHES